MNEYIIIDTILMMIYDFMKSTNWYFLHRHIKKVQMLFSIRLQKYSYLPLTYSNIIFCIMGIVLVCFLYLVNFLFAYFNIGWHFDICQSVYYKIKP